MGHTSSLFSSLNFTQEEEEKHISHSGLEHSSLFPHLVSSKRLPSSDLSDAHYQNILAPNGNAELFHRFTLHSQFRDSGLSNHSFTRKPENNICKIHMTNKHGQNAFTKPDNVNCFRECLEIVPLVYCGTQTANRTFWSLDFEIKQKGKKSAACIPFNKERPSIRD